MSVYFSVHCINVKILAKESVQLKIRFDYKITNVVKELSNRSLIAELFD